MRLLDNFILFGWVVFWLYWLISAFGSKKNLGSRANGGAGIRLGIFLLTIIFVRISLRQAHFFGEYQPSSHSDILLGLGTALFVAGLLLAIWARLYLGKNWGMPMSLKQDPELVTTGPYGFIRHPIYSGLLMAIIGTALASSFYWLLLFLVSGCYFIYSAVAEERIMTKEFPKGYPEYKRRTKMLIPLIF